MANPLAEFLSDVARLEPVAHDDRTATRILDGALDEASAHGLRSLSIEAVARRAGVNRVTVYRRFGDREGLVAALAAREGHRMSAALAQAVARIDDPAQRLAEGFVESLRYARSHPLMMRAARVEPESVVAAALADDAALLRIGSSFMARAVLEAQRGRGSTHVDPDQAGETLARLFASFVLLPGGALDPTDEVAMRDYARRTLVPMVLGHQVGHHPVVVETVGPTE
jgi:AcrR family transcriptional regulator